MPYFWFKLKPTYTTLNYTVCVHCASIQSLLLMFIFGRYLHMLQHVYRSQNFTKPNQYVKCFHNPERALILHNHFPLACLGSGCTSYGIETTDAQLQHYRADCVKTLKKSCTEYRQKSVLDTTIWKFKEKLILQTTVALKTLGFL